MRDGRHRRGHELAHPPRVLCILLAGPRLLCEEDECDSSTPRGTGGGVHPLGCPRSTHRHRASPSLASAGSLAATTRAGMAVASKAKGCATDLVRTSCSRCLWLMLSATMEEECDVTSDWIISTNWLKESVREGLTSRSISSVASSRSAATSRSPRILCASELIGSVIGKSGANVRRVEQQTGVRIKVQEIDKDASGERLITVSSNEIPTEPISPTIEALILLHDKVAGPPAIARGALTEIASRLRTRTLRDTSTANSPPPFAPSDDPPGILNTVYMNILLASPLLKAILKDATAV
uniref:K Homology domain-containing protein n=1 Tax=Zea mays TaxID=4577 RepID=A0A804UII2_MAIZE